MNKDFQLLYHWITVYNLFKKICVTVLSFDFRFPSGSISSKQYTKSRSAIPMPPLSSHPWVDMEASIKAIETTSTNSKQKLWKPHWITWAWFSWCPNEYVHVLCQQPRPPSQSNLLFAVFIVVSAIICTGRALTFNDIDECVSQSGHFSWHRRAEARSRNLLFYLFGNTEHTHIHSMS